MVYAHRCECMSQPQGAGLEQRLQRRGARVRSRRDNETLTSCLNIHPKLQPMIQLIGRKGTVGFDHLCVCVCVILASQGMTKMPSFPILMCQTWHNWHHCCTCRCVQRVCAPLGPPPLSIFSRAPSARVCMCAVFSSRKSFPLTTSADTLVAQLRAPSLRRS